MKYNLKAAWLFVLGITLTMSVTDSSQTIEGHEQIQLTHFQRAEEYLEAGEYDKAIEEYVKSIEVEPENGWAYWGIVEAYHEADNPEGAKTFLESVLRENPNSPGALYGLSHYYCRNAEWDKSLDFTDKALEIDPQFPYAYHTAGAVFFRTGRYREAIKAWEDALRFYRQRSDRRAEAAMYRNIGIAHRRLGQLREALPYCLEALGIFRKLGQIPGEILTLNNLGILYAELGDLSNALKFHLASLKLTREKEDLRSQAANLNNISRIYSDLGDRTRALEYLEQSLTLNKKVGYKKGEISNLNNIGKIYARLNRPEEALSFYNQSLKLAQEHGFKELEAENFHNIGEVERKLVHPEAALQFYSKALELSREMGMRVREARTLNAIGATYLMKGVSSQALDYCQEALRLTGEEDTPAVTWSCQYNLGKIYEGQKDFEKAHAYYELATGTIEGVREKLRVEEFKTGYMVDKMDVYNRMVAVLLEMGRVEEAFDCVERAKARSLLDMLTQSQVTPEGISEELEVESHSIEVELREIQTTLTKENAKEKPDQNLIDELSERLQSVKKAHQEVLEKIALHHSRYAAMTGISKPLTLKEVQDRVLEDNQVLIEYFVGEEKTFVWGLRKESVGVVEIDVKREDLETMVVRLRKPFIDVKNLMDVDFDLNMAHKLYQKVFRPAVRFIRAEDKVLIVPDGVLHYLPFECLVTNVGSGNENRYARADYLIEEIPICYAPSASVLDPGLRPQESSQIQFELLALGDPSYYGMTEDERALRGGIGWNFQLLPYSEREVRTIADLYDRSRWYIEENATEDHFKVEANRCEIIHLSAHGLLDENMPMYSGIVLTQDEDAAEDGFLQAYEIFDLRLNAELVTLSGCETGLGEMKRGEGLIGLARAFMYSGAKSLVVSLWSVNDESTCEIMEAFYSNMRAKGLSKVEALRQAKLELMEMEKDLGDGMKLSYALPFFWAPFILIGS